MWKVAWISRDTFGRMFKGCLNQEQILYITKKLFIKTDVEKKILRNIWQTFQHIGCRKAKDTSAQIVKKNLVITSMMPDIIIGIVWTFLTSFIIWFSEEKNGGKLALDRKIHELQCDS